MAMFAISTDNFRRCDDLAITMTLAGLVSLFVGLFMKVNEVK